MHIRDRNWSSPSWLWTYSRWKKASTPPSVLATWGLSGAAEETHTSLKPPTHSMRSLVLREICTKAPHSLWNLVMVSLGGSEYSEDDVQGLVWTCSFILTSSGIHSAPAESREHGQSGPGHGLQLSTQMLQSSYGKVVWFSYEEKKIKAFFFFIWKKGQVDNLRILKVFSQRMFPSLLEIWTNHFLIFDGTLQFINTFYFCHMIISFSPQFPLMVS